MNDSGVLMIIEERLKKKKVDWNCGSKNFLEINIKTTSNKKKTNNNSDSSFFFLPSLPIISFREIGCPLVFGGEEEEVKRKKPPSIFGYVVVCCLLLLPLVLLVGWGYRSFRVRSQPNVSVIFFFKDRWF